MNMLENLKHDEEKRRKEAARVRRNERNRLKARTTLKQRLDELLKDN